MLFFCILIWVSTGFVGSLFAVSGLNGTCKGLPKESVLSPLPIFMSVFFGPFNLVSGFIFWLILQPKEGE